MRYISSIVPPSGILAGLAAAVVLALQPASLTAQLPEADSLALLEQAREVQARYERLREQHTPPDFATLSQRCDDVVGRFCFRFEPHEPGEEWVPPEPPLQLEMGLTQVVRELREVSRHLAGDRWLTGQRVYYYGKVGAWRDAARVAQSCGAEPWWCTALMGYVYHGVGEWEEADRIFERAVAEMPPDTALAWLRPDHVLQRGAEDVLERAEDRDALLRRLWTLSDPLYLVPGNDRKTEHHARQVLMRVRSLGENDTGKEWREDLDQITLQWGEPRAWTRERDRPEIEGGRVFGTMSIEDTREMVSHRWGLDFLPNVAALDDPAELRSGDWQLGERKRLEIRDYEGFQDPLGLSAGASSNTPEPRINILDPEEILTAVEDAVKVEGPQTGYEPPYAKRFDRLLSQVARFRRGDSLLVVGAYVPAPDPPRGGSGSTILSGITEVDLRERRSVSRTERQQATRNPFAVQEETPEPLVEVAPPIEAGLFLIGTETETHAEARSEDRRGVLRLQVPNGHYIVGLEAFSPTERRAWRERHGAWQESLVPGLAAMSDLLVLESGPTIPESLDEALPNALPSLRVRSGDAIHVAWEVYGLRIGETARVRIGVNEVSVGALSRIGQFLRVISPDSPVDMSWEEAGPDVLGTVFRAVELVLPEMDPGDYELAVEVEPSGREPMRVTRRITIEPR